MSHYVYNEFYRRPRHPWRVMQLFMVLLSTVGVIGYVTTTSSTAAQAQLQKKPVLSSSTSAGQIDNGSLNWNPGIEANDLLESTNAERLQNNLAPVQANNLLALSASAKCSDMVAKDYWAHNDPNGLEPWHFIDETGYKKQAAGENLAYGFTDSSAVMAGWMRSPTHRAAILSPLYNEVGFGICKSSNFIKSGPQTIVVQHFGKPLP